MMFGFTLSMIYFSSGSVVGHSDGRALNVED